jgi:hypothetical protein
VVDDRVETTRIAQTILRLLGLNPDALQAVSRARRPSPRTEHSIDAATVGGARCPTHCDSCSFRKPPQRIDEHRRAPNRTGPGATVSRDDAVRRDKR